MIMLKKLFLKNLIQVLCILTCLIATATTAAQFSVSERTYKKLKKVESFIEEKAYPDAISLLKSLESSSASRKYELTLIYQAYGYIYYESNKTAKAIDYFEKAQQLNFAPAATLQNIRINLIQLYAIQDNPGKAIAHFETWISKAESPQGHMLALGGSLYAKLKKYDLAIQYLKRAIASSKPAQESWYRSLLSVYYQREDYVAAIDLLQELIQQYPDNKEYWAQLFSGFYAQQKHHKALSVLELGYTKELLISQDDITNLAKLYLFLGTPMKAVKLVNDELKSGRLPENKNNLELLANAYLHARQTAQSASAYRKLSQKIADPEYAVKAARLFIDARQWKEALDTLDTIQNDNTQNTKPGQLQLLKGIALLELKQFPKAQRAFQLAQKQPDAQSDAKRWLQYLDQLNHLP